MKNFWSTFISISIWAVVFALCLVFLRNCNRPQFAVISMADDSLVKEIEERKGLVDWSQLQVDSTGTLSLASSIDSASFDALKNKILREEIKAGRLLTADQMSEKITGYYDKLIDVLIALFVLFTVVSYIAINSKFREKYEEDKAKIIVEIEDAIIKSHPLHKDLENTITTRIGKNTVTEDTIHDIREKLAKNDEYFDLLASVCDDLTEEAARKTEIEDPEEDNNLEEA